MLVVAGLLGFAGNEWVARYRIRVGREIGSAALVADGLHALPRLTEAVIHVQPAGAQAEAPRTG